MKKYVLIILFIISFCIVTKAQYEYDPVTVKTPTNVSVNALEFDDENYDDFDEDEIAIQNANWTDGYNCTIIANSTKYYNCHGYAWHNIEGNMSTSNLRWINDVDQSSNPIYNVFKYYDDNYAGGNKSYKQVTSNDRSYLKISYFPRDHSAISTSNTNIYRSKWAWGPLVEHAPAQCPFYQNAVIKFYNLNNKVIGSTNPLCYNVQRTFNTNITNMSSASFSWSKGQYLVYVSGSGTSEYKVKGSSGQGSSFVSLQITTPSGLLSPSSIMNLWVGIPDYQYLQVRDYYTKYTNPNLCLYDDNYLEVFMDNGADEVQGVNYWGWNLISGGNLYAPDYPYDVAIATPMSSYFSFQYRAHNTCGWSSYMNNTLNAYYCGYYYSYSPNPVSDQLKIEAVTESGKAISDLQNDIPVEFEATLYNSDKQIVKQGKSEDSKIIIDIGNLKNGTYFLHILDIAGNYDVIKEQIIIN